jgi:hypothetical protein
MITRMAGRQPSPAVLLLMRDRLGADLRGCCRDDRPPAAGRFPL